MPGLGLGLGLGVSRAGSGLRPTIDLNFMGGALDSRITFTRASSATYTDVAGVLQTATTNAARFDYDPATLAPRGLLIEEARTNSLRNNSMTGATVGVLGSGGAIPTNWQAGSGHGLTWEVVGTGTETGVPYIDFRISGTSSGASTQTYFLATESNTQIAATAAQVWTGSCFVKLVGGSLANITRFYQSVSERTAAGAFVTSGETNFTPTSTRTRVTASRTLTGGTTERVTYETRVVFGDGVAVDCTLRIGAPQLELGSFATSPILTTSAAATRAVDICHVLTGEFPFNAAAGTLFAEFTPTGVTGLQTVVYLDDGTTNERMGIRSSSGTNAMLAVDGGVTQVNASVGAVVAGTTYKVAMSYVLNDFAGCQNGGTVATDVVVTLPTVTRFLIGSRLSGSEVMSGHYKRVRYYPIDLDNATLQGITS